MKPKSFMIIAGETSGDMLAAELVHAITHEFERSVAVPTADFQPLHASFEPRFFGAGGPRMAAAGVDIAFDMTAHSVTGFSDAVKHYVKFRGFLHQLFRLALEKEPDAIICVDFGAFNRRFAHAIKEYVRPRLDWFHDWNPKIIQYVSPQVWASREGRAQQIRRDYDLLLSIFPFEKDWYDNYAPGFRVEFVGNPIIDRHSEAENAMRHAESSPQNHPSPTRSSPNLVLLPGSRADELRRHLPVMLASLEKVRAALPDLRACMVLPNENLIQQIPEMDLPPYLKTQTSGLSEVLAQADIAIASTGTVTMECAYFGVPTVAIYKTSWITYEIAKRMAKVKFVAMPNLLANEELFPEFIQNAATPENLARAALELLRDEPGRKKIERRLREIISSLGGPGASQRAAELIVALVAPESSPNHR